MKTFDQMSFRIEIDSQRFDLLDLIIVQGDLDMIIHLSDRGTLTQWNEMFINIWRTIGEREKVLGVSEEMKYELLKFETKQVHCSMILFRSHSIINEGDDGSQSVGRVDLVE